MTQNLSFRNYEDIPVNLGRLEIQVDGLCQSIREFKRILERVSCRLENLERESYRWRGGAQVLLGLSAIIGAISAYVLKFL